MTKRVVALLLVLTAGACSRTPTPEAGELLVTPLEGSVTLIDGGERLLLDEAKTVDQGISILTEAGARAKVELPGERSMELAPSTELRVDAAFSEVSDGSVLVQTPSPMRLRAGGAEIEATDGAFRIDRESSVLLATYSGAATVLGSGVPPVSALRQASVLPGGEVPPPGVEALVVRPNDPWDARLLGGAIDLGLQLLTYERGLTRQLPSGREATAVSRMLERDFSARAIRGAIAELGNAARAVVAAVVAQEAARLDGGSSRRILSQILGLQSLGASWMVIVAEWGLPTAAAALTQRLGDLADSISEAVAPPPAPALTGASSSAAAAPGSSPSQAGDGPTGGGRTPPDGGPSGGGGDGDSTTQPPDPPPAENQQPQNNTQPAPPPPQSCANAVECTVDGILDDPPRNQLPI